MRVFAAALAACLFSLFQANPTNVTIDDYFGDENSGRVPTYTGPTNNAWLAANATVMGIAKPDPAQALRQTWHDSTYHPGDASPRAVELDFVGTAVYAFFILGNAIPPIPLITALTNLSFHLDDTFEGIYEHDPDMDDTNFEYNVLGFSKDGLVNTAHKLLIQTTTGNASLVLFDYVVYTADNSTVISPSDSGASGGLPVITIEPTATSSSTKSGDTHHINVGILIGIASASSALSTEITLLIIILLRRRAKRKSIASFVTSSDGAQFYHHDSPPSPTNVTPYNWNWLSSSTQSRERHKSELVEEERQENLQAAAERREAKCQWREHVASRWNEVSII